MTPISPEEWRTRIPWHVKARICGALDGLAQEYRDELEALKEHVALLRREARELEFAAVEARKVAHAAYFRGERDEWVVTGERAYQRNRKRNRRASERKAS